MTPSVFKPRAPRLALRHARGITLIELLVVFAAIGGIMLGLGLVMLEADARSKQKAAMRDMERLDRAMETYREEREGCPKTQTTLIAAGIVKRPLDDPWGTTYAFACPATHGKRSVMSAGEDREWNTEDDLDSSQLEPR